MMDPKLEYNYNIFSNTYMLPLSGDAGKTREQILLMATISFAKFGYASVSMRDIAKIMGFHQSSLYNYFESKESLWREVVEHAGNLYLLYFDHLNSIISAATTFDEVLEAIFHEPKRLGNIFTSYAFTMIQNEQIRDGYAGKMFEEVFMGHGIAFLKEWFEKCIARGMVREFDTQTVAIIIMHSVFMGLQEEVHRHLNHQNQTPYDPEKMFQDVQNFLSSALVEKETLHAVEL